MQRLTLAATQLTPSIDFDYEHDKLRIEGESYPEDVSAFYGPILSSLRDYLGLAAELNRTVHVGFALRYVNSSSTKSLQQMIALLDAAARAGALINIVWTVDADDEVMTELGVDVLADKSALKYEIVSR